MELTFAERPDEPTSAVPLTRLQEARAWDQRDQRIELVSETSRLTGALPDGAAVVGGAQSWGIVDRIGDGAGAFFLEYYTKAAVTAADAAVSVNLPLEIFARRDGPQVIATLRRGETALSNATLHVYTPPAGVFEYTTDTSGTTRFDANKPGLYGLRTRWIEPRSGEFEGQRFAEVRHYSTLTFQVEQPAASENPTEAAATKPSTANPEAYSLLKAAHETRQVMPADFAGFRCELILREGDHSWSGTVVYRRGAEIQVDLTELDPDRREWVRDQLLNVIGHRRGGDFASGDGRYPLELAQDDGNPFGRLVVLHDAMDSRYRVRDNKVLEVTRTAEGSRFTITVIETMEADAGKYLANHFLVSYRDASSGALQKVEGYRDSYAHVDGVWLPDSRTVVAIAGETSPRVRTIRLRKHQRL